MQMHGRHVAGVVDRDGAADRVGDLQAPVQSGIEQENALPIGELDRGDVGLLCDLGNLREVTAILIPLPHIRRGFHLVYGDAAAGKLAGAFAAGLAEPRSLCRRVGLRADPNVVLAGVGVDGLHQLARFVGKPGWGRGLHCHRGHDDFSSGAGASASLLILSARGCVWAKPVPNLCREDSELAACLQSDACSAWRCVPRRKLIANAIAYRS